MGEQSGAGTDPAKGRKAAGKKAVGKKAAGKKAVGKKAGRPGLGAKGGSVQIAFRVVPGVRKRAKEAADREGLTVSQLSRKALKQYLDAATPVK